MKIGRSCLIKYGSQMQFGNHMTRCIEEENSNMSKMNPEEKITLDDSYMKIDPQKWGAADIECKDILVYNPGPTSEKNVRKQTSSCRL